jgi:hypothetical protein
MSVPSGITLDLSVDYDDIGSSNYHARTRRAMVRVPLQ